jgi:hypothetical protein
MDRNWKSPWFFLLEGSKEKEEPKNNICRQRAMALFATMLTAILFYAARCTFTVCGW